MNSQSQDHASFTASVVCAFLTRTALDVEMVPDFIRSVAQAIRDADAPAPAVIPVAVDITATIDPDFIVCLETGRKFRSLKKHLTAIGLTPEQYRRKWGLPQDYPMVAPNYAQQRSEIARRNVRRNYGV